MGCWLLLCAPADGRPAWTELNVGPFRVDTDTNESAARATLAQLEQLRWILGGMLENKDLSATWPFRLILTGSVLIASPSFTLAHGEYVWAAAPRSQAPLSEVARLFLESNTPRLPAEVDSALPVLFDGLEARGAQVTWAKPASHRDLAWARLHMFVTKPEYRGRFPVFLNNLKAGSLLSVAEANAFGKDSKTLEREAVEYLAANTAQAITMSARPLDPKRDFGEHSLDPVLAELYLADARLHDDPKTADQAYKAASAAGYSALAQEGFARLVLAENGDPREYLDAAMAAGSKNAWVYAEAAQGRPPAEAAGLLRTARELNPRWGAPVAALAEITENAPEKESLLAEACAKSPRDATLWERLAILQSDAGRGLKAQNSWIRAEDAAATPAEREQIHQRRQAMETARLDAQDRVRAEADQAARGEEARLKTAQEDRIRAAEEKANAANGGSPADGVAEQDKSGDTPGGKSGGQAMPWWNEGERPAEGELLRIDCSGDQTRVLVKPGTGKPLLLLVPEPAKSGLQMPDQDLPCGTLASPKRVRLTYKLRPDKKLGTAGDLVTIRFE